MPFDLYVYYKIAPGDLPAYGLAIRALQEGARNVGVRLLVRRRITEREPVTCMESASFERVEMLQSWKAHREALAKEIDCLVVDGAVRFEEFCDL